MIKNSKLIMIGIKISWNVVNHLLLQMVKIFTFYSLKYKLHFRGAQSTW